MTGSKKQQPAKAKAKKQNQPRQKPRPSAMPATMGKYINLLSDACAAEFTQPPYAGSDSGYLVRTQELITLQPAISTSIASGTPIICDAMIQVVPIGYGVAGSLGLAAVSAAVGVQFVLPPITSTAFVTNTAVVPKFRPVAACLKYLPNGPYANRAGTVGSAYQTGQMVIPSVTAGNAQAHLTTCQRISPMGSEEHMVRWLPTPADELWSDPSITDTSNAGGGAMVMVLSGCDGVSLGSGTGQLNGLFEVTIVWEWCPASKQGITAQPTAPPNYTVQQVLSAIGDTTKFVFHGLQRTGFFNQAVTYGMRQIMQRGENMPRLPRGSS